MKVKVEARTRGRNRRDVAVSSRCQEYYLGSHVPQEIEIECIMRTSAQISTLPLHQRLSPPLSLQ